MEGSDCSSCLSSRSSTAASLCWTRNSRREHLRLSDEYSSLKRLEVGS